MELKAQGVSELERLRLENRRLREDNQALKEHLKTLQEETVFSLWDELADLTEEDDGVYDYSGFGLAGERLESDFERKVMGVVPSFQIPYNAVFEKYIDLYTISRKKQMTSILGRYRKYLPRFRKTFAKYNIPEELVALCIVESAVSRKALSRVGALGMWQLMPETARQYGLVVNDVVDERMDVVLATDVAARVLRDLKKSLGSWELAVLAYNCGSGNVRKAIIRSGGKTGVWDIYDHLPAETRAYLPSLVGAVYCERYHEEYKIPVKQYAPEQNETHILKGDRTIAEIAKVADVRPEALAEMNCQYLRGFVPAGMAVTVPKGYLARIKEL